MESEKDRKRRFKLFFEYLKRNSQYQKCWKWVTNNFNENKFDVSELKNNPYNYETFLMHWVIFGKPFENIDIALTYQKYKSAPLSPAYIFNLEKETQNLKELFEGMNGMIPIELTVENFILAIKETLCRKDNFYVKIDIDSNYSLKEITAEVQDIVKKEREKRKIQNIRKRNAGLDELQRYLTVYDTRETIINGKKRTWKEVHKIVYPIFTKHNIDLFDWSEKARLQLNHDYNNAKLIIKNSIKCDDPREFPRYVVI